MSENHFLINFLFLKVLIIFSLLIMSQSETSLFSKVTIGGITLQNRIALAPLTRSRCGTDQSPGLPWYVEYYTQRASAGLLISDGTVISKQGMGWDGCPAIYEDHHVEGWKQVTNAVHAKGGAIFVQLWHLGRVAHSSYHGLQPVSASAIAAQGGAHLPNKEKRPYETPRALEISEIAGVVEDFRHAAENAKKAGFDGVELHGANGYFLDQFLQSVSNERADEYGGSIEKRFRIIKEIIEAVSTVWPSNRIGIRLSPNGMYNSMGSVDNFETFTYAFKELNKLDLAYVHVMDGLAFGYHEKCPPFTLEDVRKSYTGIIIGNCGYTKETAETVVRAGNADLVAFGRLFISNPDLVERFKNNWELAPPAHYSVFYGSPSSDADPRIGYSDFPAYTPREL